MEDPETYPSDSSDEDYVPGKDTGDEEDVSDVEESYSDVDANDHVGEVDKAKNIKRKRLKNKQNIQPRKRKGGIKLEDGKEQKVNVDDNADAENVCDKVESKVDNEEEHRAKANALWADFLKDVDSKTSKSVNSKPNVSDVSLSNCKTSSSPSSGVGSTVIVTKVYEFAGEEIRVQEEVDVDSKDAKRVQLQEIDAQNSNTSQLASLKPGLSVRSGQPSGLNSVLSKLGKNKKMSTLEKSRLDWNSFKDQEGITEDLKTFNRGKDGYLEKQAFLQRADERQFELEKTLRVTNRSNR